jgi:hypothetical protein
MGRQDGSRMLRVLFVAVAVVLSAGVLSATQVDPRPATTVAAEGRVAPVGFGQASLLDDPPPTRPAVAAPAPEPSPRTVPVAPPTTPSTIRPTSTTTTAAPAKAGTSTTRPTVPRANVPAASSWQGVAEGVSARMRLEPAAPTAGQPVRIHIDVSGELDCCYIFLHFGDDTDGFALNNDWMCQGVSPLSPGAHSTVVTHTYARPGAYRRRPGTGGRCRLRTVAHHRSLPDGRARPLLPPVGGSSPPV